MREDLRHLQQEVKETQEKPIKHTSWLKEITYGIKAPREETPRERTMRLFPHLMPSPALVKRVKREIGVTSLGSPGLAEDFQKFGTWAKEHWQGLTLGGGCFLLLLAVIAAGKRS